jgi:hypothetical protein
MPPVDDCEIENSIDYTANNINPLSKQICEEYLTASIRASAKLGISNDLERRDNALIACIHDYETTGNTNVRERCKNSSTFCIIFNSLVRV